MSDWKYWFDKKCKELEKKQERYELNKKRTLENYYRNRERELQRRHKRYCENREKVREYNRQYYQRKRKKAIHVEPREYKTFTDDVELSTIIDFDNY